MQLLQDLVDSSNAVGEIVVCFELDCCQMTNTLWSVRNMILEKVLSYPKKKKKGSLLALKVTDGMCSNNSLMCPSVRVHGDLFSSRWNTFLLEASS